VSTPDYYPDVLKTIEVLADLLVAELGLHAPIAFSGVKAERDALVEAIRSAPEKFAEWWARELEARR